MKTMCCSSLAMAQVLNFAMVAAAAPNAATYVGEPIGTPLGEGKLVLEVTIVVMGMKVTKTVTIPSGDIKKFERPKRMPNENIRDYAQRVLDAQGEASQAKSKVIADAVNKEFDKEFMKLGDKAGSGLKIVENRTIKVEGQNVPGLSAAFGSLIIPGVSREKDQAGKEVSGIVWKENKILGEGGNIGRFVDPARPSSGTRGSLDRVEPGVTQIASGLDPLGDQSLVEFGIDGLYVAQVEPTAGMTDTAVLGLLASLLTAHGVPATLNPTNQELFLDRPIPDGQALVWGNTDTEFAFRTAFEGLDPVEVPEPGSAWLLVASGPALMMGLRRARRQTPGIAPQAARSGRIDRAAHRPTRA